MSYLIVTLLLLSYFAFSSFNAPPHSPRSPSLRPPPPPPNFCVVDTNFISISRRSFKFRVSLFGWFRFSSFFRRFLELIWPPPPEKFYIFVKSLDGKTISVPVFQCDSIYSIKIMVHSKLGKLIYLLL